jgi:hypothetical protein
MREILAGLFLVSCIAALALFAIYSAWKYCVDDESSKQLGLGFLYGIGHFWRWPFGARAAQLRNDWIEAFTGPSKGRS